MLLIVAFPSIKILMVAFVYKFAAAIMQPLGGGPVIKCLDIISKSVMYVFASLAMVLPDVFSEFNGHYCGGEFNGDGPLNREVMAYRIFERVGHEYHIICPVGNSH